MAAPDDKKYKFSNQLSNEVILDIQIKQHERASKFIKMIPKANMH